MKFVKGMSKLSVLVVLVKGVRLGISGNGASASTINKKRVSASGKIESVKFTLFSACHHGEIELVEQFLARKTVSVNHAYNFATPLMCASEKGHCEVINYSNTFYFFKYENNKIIITQTIIVFLVFCVVDCYYHSEIVHALLADKRIEVDKTDQEGWTALMIASQRGHFAVVELINYTINELITQ